MKLQQFNGGLNTRLEPQFAALNQGRVYNNIDTDLGSLGPVLADAPTGISVQLHQTWYDHAQEWVSSVLRRDYVEYEKVLYWTDRISTPQRYDGTNQTNLGIEPPPQLTDFTVEAANAAPNSFTFNVAFNLVGLPTDDYYYVVVDKEAGLYSKITYVKVGADYSVEVLGESLNELPTPPDVVTNAIPTNFVVTMSGFEGAPLGRRAEVYRFYKNKWHQVTTLGTGDLGIDNTLDISANDVLEQDDFPALSGVYQYVMTYYNETIGSESGPSPVSDEINISEGGTVVLNNLPISSDNQVTHKKLYRVGGNIAAFTLVTTLANSVTSFTDDVVDTELKNEQLASVAASQAPAGLAFLQTAYAMLFGAVDNKLRFTPIGEPTSWPETYFLEFEAPITGIAPVGTGVLVFTKFRTHIVTGTGPTTLSKYLLSGDQGCIAHESVQLVGNEAVWASTDGICRSSGNRPTVMTKALLGKLELTPFDSCVYDETYYLVENDKSVLAIGDGVFKNFTFDVNTLNVANDKLYGFRSGELVEIFGGDEPYTFNYKSGKLTEGSFTIIKNYKKIFIYSEGYVKINIIIDGESAVVKEFTTTDSHVVQIPQQLQRGSYIQFEIEGTGKVHEIEYDPHLNEK